MTQRIAIRRKNNFNLLREIGRLSSFDEFPMLRPEVDPQLHASRNSVDLPFYLICRKDTLLAQMNGKARVMFRDGPVRYFDLGPGDHVYVPGGTPHRILTIEPGAQMRYKARQPGFEGMLWYCDHCGAELDRHVWNSDETVPQQAYHFAATRHNDEPERRRCKSCGGDHPPLDLAPFRWRAVADALLSDGEA